MAHTVPYVTRQLSECRVKLGLNLSIAFGRPRAAAWCSACRPLLSFPAPVMGKRGRPPDAACDKPADSAARQPAAKAKARAKAASRKASPKNEGKAEAKSAAGRRRRCPAKPHKQPRLKQSVMFHALAG